MVWHLSIYRNRNLYIGKIALRCANATQRNLPIYAPYFAVTFAQLILIVNKKLKNGSL